MTHSAPPSEDESTKPPPAAQPPEPAPAVPTRSDLARRQSQLLDEGLEETFPASDPVSIVRVD
jgi:hypothetical protein